MRIVSLQAENIKRLKAVQIKPEGNTVVISGRNGQGKTSVLDAIWFGLGGGAATKETPRPIRDGEKSASVTLDLGDYIVTRSWTANDKSYLKVENKDGARFPSPQAMLDKLVGHLSFDPLAFAQMDNKAQLQALLSVVKLDVDPGELDANRKEAFDERTQVNRIAKQLEGQLGGMPAPEPGLPPTEISAADIMAEIEAATAQQRQNDSKRNELREAERKVGNWHRIVRDGEADIHELEQRLAKLREARAKDQQAASDAQAIADSLAAEVVALTDPDLSVYRQRLATVEKINAQIRAARDRAGVVSRLREARLESDALSRRMANIDQRKSEIMQSAAFPVEGLAFDEDGITYNGIPFRQCSDAEKLRISMAMAMALNPRLRVIRITDGSLLDSHNLRVIEDLAASNDFQVWIERVDESGKVGIYIEDGEVKSAPTLFDGGAADA